MNYSNKVIALCFGVCFFECDTNLLIYGTFCLMFSLITTIDIPRPFIRLSTGWQDMMFTLLKDW